MSKTQVPIVPWEALFFQPTALGVIYMYILTSLMCTSYAHPLEQNTQEAENYAHGQVHTCSIAHLCEYRTHTSREPAYEEVHLAATNTTSLMLPMNVHITKHFTGNVHAVVMIPNTA